MGESGHVYASFQTPLNYGKGYIFSQCTNLGEFNPWSDATPAINCTSSSSGLQFRMYAQPLLTDMEIDDDGSLIMAFKDRSGLQMGAVNVTPENTVENNMNGGDILRACNVGGMLVIQGGAGCAVKSANSEGPGGGEWYFGDTSGSTVHQENTLGGLALVAGSDEVLSSCYTCRGTSGINNSVTNSRARRR